jgi:hypothetical protein
MDTATVIRILELAAPLDWGRFNTGSNEEGPSAPLIVWRYKDEPDWVGEQLARQVAGFTGSCVWVLEKPRHNWVLWTSRQKSEFEAGDWSTDSAYFAWLAREDPEFCGLATSELVTLFERLEKSLLASRPGPNNKISFDDEE